MKNISPTAKGFITGMLMVAFSLFVFYVLKKPAGSYLYILFLMYTAGILWNQFEFNKTAVKGIKFQPYFSYGFKCFIIVVLLMSAYAFIFFSMHPEIRESTLAENSKQLLKQGNHTPAEIEAQAQSLRSVYMIVMLSGTIFLYLFAGAIITAIISAFMIQKKK